MEFSVQGLGIGVQGLGSTVHGLGLRVWSPGFRAALPPSVFEAHRLLHHSALGLRVIKKRRSYRLPRVLQRRQRARGILLGVEGFGAGSWGWNKEVTTPL